MSTEPAQCRDLAKLKPELRAKVEYILGELRRKGYHPFVIETWRSPARQAWLRQQKPPVTKVVHSKHQDGAACDIGFSVAGKATWSPLYKGWYSLGWLARSQHLTWGGAWLRLRDYPHIELP